MGMTPSRKTVEKITLGDLAADNRLIVVRCNHCRRTSHFLASDLVTVYGATAKMHGVFHSCSRCNRSDFLYVGTRLPDAADEGVLKVRRPKWAWREVPYQNPIKRPQTASDAIARSRSGGTGGGHHHEEPLTMEQATQISLLNSKGFWEPNFATKKERLEWLEQNRWRLEKPKP